MEIKKIFESPFKTAKEKGLKSERDIVDIKINWDSPKGDTFLVNVVQMLLKHILWP